MMVFKVDKKLLNKELILNILRISYNNEFIGIIVPDITNDEITKIYEDCPLPNTRLKIYNGTIIVDEDNKNNFNLDSYIEEVLSENIDTNIIDMFYLQRIEHFSGEFPLSNNIFEILENGNIERNGIIYGDIEKGINLELLSNDKLLCLKGKFTSNLNPLYNFDKIGKELKNMINIEECQLKDSLLEKVSKEVREVSKENFIYLMEMMGLVRESNKILVESLLKGITNKNE